jgi:hypothetical protein
MKIHPRNHLEIHPSKSTKIHREIHHKPPCPTSIEIHLEITLKSTPQHPEKSLKIHPQKLKKHTLKKSLLTPNKLLINNYKNRYLKTSARQRVFAPLRK